MYQLDAYNWAHSDKNKKLADLREAILGHGAHTKQQLGNLEAKLDRLFEFLGIEDYYEMPKLYVRKKETK